MAKKKKKTTKTVTFTGGSLSLSSKWEVEERIIWQAPPIPAQQTKQLVFKSGPTLAAGSTSISYNVPSGVKIKSAVVTATYASPWAGISMLTMNGARFAGSASASISGNAGTFNCTFQYRANGQKKVGANVCTLTLSNITLKITYEDGESDKEKEKEQPKSGLKFRVPPQSVCVYDQDEKKLYTFDGVIKIQQSMTLKIEEDPSKKKELYVNNARNEPDKVTLDVMMSDVYGDMAGGQLTVEASSFDANSAQSIGSGGGNTRSSRAVAVLHTLKESRRMLTVVTPQYVYTDMLLQGITISQDDTCPYGWQGQLTFQEKYEVIQKKDKTSSDGTNRQGETESLLVKVRDFFSGIFGKK